MINIWFDGWFSSAFNIIELIKRNPENRPVKIFGSHYKEMGYKILCDEWFIRPNFKEYDENDDKEFVEKEYVRWAQEFCERNKIDIFFPCKYLKELSRENEQFEMVGTKLVLPENENTLNQLLSKVSTHCLLNDCCNTPPMWMLHDLADIEEFKTQLKEDDFKYDKLCIKPDVGTGGDGFRILNYPYDVSITQEMLRKYSLVIMPYLNGEEISIDCLKANNGLIAIPRHKYSNTRIQEIKLDERLLFLAKEIDSILDLNVPYNIQFRKHNNMFFLLEVNPRMSGGIYLSSLAGVNIPWLTVKKMLGEKIEKPEIKEISVCNVERGIII